MTSVGPSRAQSVFLFSNPLCTNGLHSSCTIAPSCANVIKARLLQVQLISCASSRSRVHCRTRRCGSGRRQAAADGSGGRWCQRRAQTRLQKAAGGSRAAMTAPLNGGGAASGSGHPHNWLNGYNTRSRANGKASSNGESVANGGLANGHGGNSHAHTSSGIGNGAMNGHANGLTNGHANGGSHKSENGRLSQQNGTADSRPPTNGSKADSKAPPMPDTRTGRPQSDCAVMCWFAVACLRRAGCLNLAAATCCCACYMAEVVMY